MIKDYLAFLILPGLLGLAFAYAVQEGFLALAWALTLGLLALAVVCLAAIAADLTLGLFSLLALGAWKLARVLFDAIAARPETLPPGEGDVVSERTP